jgi:hypothetical protein
MKYLKRFEQHEDTYENIAHIRAVFDDFCEKYDFKLVVDYNCFEIRYNQTLDGAANSTSISAKEFKFDLIRFFKKIEAHHTRETVDRLDIDIITNNRKFSYENLFNKERADDFYRRLDSITDFKLMKLNLSLRYTYKYY